MAGLNDGLGGETGVFGVTEDMVKIGTSSVDKAYSAGSPLFQMYATNAGTSGSTSAEPFYVKSTLTGTGQVGGRSRFHTYSNVTSGGWVNALKSYMEFGTSGKNTGLASSMCVEMKMPNASTGTGGQYWPLEIEYVAGGSSLVTQGALNGNCAGFIYMGASGDTNGDFDDNGYLMRVAGLTAGSGHLLSAASLTLRVGIATTTKYLFLSSIENGIGIGASGSSVSYTAGTPLVSIYATNAGTSGSTSAEPFYVYSCLTGTGQVGARARFDAYTDVVAGGWINALKSYISFGTSGGGTGIVSSFCCEMNMPNSATLSTDRAASYYPLEIELGVPANVDLGTGGPGGFQAGFIYMNAYTTPAEFDDHGYLFYLDGVSMGEGHLFDECTAGAASHALKVNINGTEYYIMLQSNVDA